MEGYNNWFVCVCVFLRNLGDSFVLLLVEPIAGKNVSPSDKKLWQFSKNILVAEKSRLIDRLPS